MKQTQEVDETVIVHRRDFGYQYQNIRIHRNALDEHLSEGWTPGSEPLSEPQAPDIEVLELKKKDAELAAENARYTVKRFDAKVVSAAEALSSARFLLEEEKRLLAEMQRAREGKTAHHACLKLFKESTVPVPGSLLLALAGSEEGEKHIRENVLTECNTAYVDSTTGERFFSLDAAAYKAKITEDAEAADKAKEAAIRARMEKAA